MKVKSIFLIFYLIPIMGFGQEIQLDKEILRKLITESTKINSVSYKVDYRFKYLSEDDTIHLQADCKLQKAPDDSLFGAMLLINRYDSIVKYYDLRSIYSVNHNTKTIIEYPNPTEQKWALKSDLTADLIKTYYINPSVLLEKIEDSVNKVEFSDTVFQTASYWTISIFYPDEQLFKDNWEQIWINKSNKLITKRIWQIKFQNNIQYAEWNLTEINFEDISSSELEKRFKAYKGQYKHEVYYEQTSTVPPMLSEDEIAPDFNGQFYPDYKRFKLSDLKDNVVLLDFFYMACYPCILAISELRELQIEYENLGLKIIGINRIDNSEKGFKKLPDFINANKINYPIVFVNKEVPALYNVQAYPSFFVINKKGEIIYSQQGYKANMKDTIKALIEKELK
ncbi:MAG TPA: TlpA disulfide reductase family protein [Bacteroidales bacterium]|nr:TlpA disulfide reductase family protein [Bacteroidales bacterium]